MWDDNPMKVHPREGAIRREAEISGAGGAGRRARPSHPRRAAKMVAAAAAAAPASAHWVAGGRAPIRLATDGGTPVRAAAAAPSSAAATQAAAIRLRPILMTSLAFILGVVPLVVATGAGENGRHSVGTTVFGGMIMSTFLNLFFIPVLYLIIEGWRERGKASRAR